MVRNAGSLAVRASRSGGAIVTDEPHGADTYRKKVDTGVGYIILVTYDPDRWRLSRGAKAKLKNRGHGARLTIEVEDKFSGPWLKPIGVFIISLKNMFSDENG
jgi:hypothetical protein